jgi:sugar-phosphatase
MELRCQGLLFDMDGILISSIPAVERAWAHWCSLRGVDFGHARSVIHGCRAVDSVRRLRPDLNAEKEMKILEDWEVSDGEGVRVLDGVQALLASLPADRWAVVTSATRRLAPARMAQAGLTPPPHLVSGDDIHQGKPHPEPFLLGAATLGLPPSQCVVFEDSESGVASGRAAGCIVLATTFTNPPEALGAADYILPDLAGIQVTLLPNEEGLLLRFTPMRRE